MHIEKIVISNFKSIKHLELSNFKRINLFIGRPNVGKSNIIEALSVFTIPQLKLSNVKKLNQLMRLEHETELFFDGNFKESIVIQADTHTCKINYDKISGLNVSLNQHHYAINEKLEIKNGKGLIQNEPIYRYIFDANAKFSKGSAMYLYPPFGNNLLNVLEIMPELKQNIQNLFNEYELKIVFDKASQSLKVIKAVEDELFLLPYNSIADTLRRVIFFKTAIASNENRILLLEEPEAHAFPPYIVEITQELIHSTTNQFFITTHSPFILNDLLQNAMDDLAIFIVDYKNHQTVVKGLTETELLEVYKYGIDLFMNYQIYL
jgi:AAA15 family ATPase/GTPase